MLLLFLLWSGDASALVIFLLFYSWLGDALALLVLAW
jgi:hypothetical protein